MPQQNLSNVKKFNLKAYNLSTFWHNLNKDNAFNCKLGKFIYQLKANKLPKIIQLMFLKLDNLYSMTQDNQK